jgi:hypothetical protein
MGTITKIRGNKPQTVAEWREYITEAVQSEVEGVIETGKRLIETRENVNHGEWEEIFKDNKPFSVQTALKRMAIARHPVLSNPAYARALPSAWNTLYELSQIPEQLLLEYIQDGEVYPELIGLEAQDLKEHEEKIQGYIAIFEGNCYQAMSLAPCDCSYLKKRVTKKLVDLHKKVAETWTHATDNLIAQGMEEEEM